MRGSGPGSVSMVLQVVTTPFCKKKQTMSIIHLFSNTSHIHVCQRVEKPAGFEAGTSQT